MAMESPLLEPFLNVSVTDPVKLGSNVQAYVSYRVITKTNFPDYQVEEKIVIRRYSDFEWLRARLLEKYKGIFVPPLPEKNAVEKFRFSVEFIELRRRALDLFVNRIASHPQLQRSKDLRSFLTEDEESMERLRSLQSVIINTRPVNLMQMFKDIQSKVSEVVYGKEEDVEESDAEYEKLKNYVFEAEVYLVEAQKQAYSLVKRHRECGQSFSDFGKSMKLLGACEGESLGSAFSVIGSKSEFLSSKMHNEAENVLLNFEEPLKDYVLAIQSIKVAMADRASAFRQQQELLQATKMKELSLERLILMRSEKVSQVEMECRELRAETEKATRHFETIVKHMNDDIVRFQNEKALDMGSAFYNLARGQAKLASEIANAWQDVLPKLDAYSSPRR